MKNFFLRSGLIFRTSFGVLHPHLNCSLMQEWEVEERMTNQEPAVQTKLNFSLFLLLFELL